MVVYAADGRTLVTCGWDKQVRLWEVGEGEPGWGREIQTLPHDWHVFSVAMTPGRQVPGGQWRGRFHVLGAASRESGWVRVKEHAGASYRSLAISPDGRTWPSRAPTGRSGSGIWKA